MGKLKLKFSLKLKPKQKVMLIAVVALILCLTVICVILMSKPSESQPEIITVPNLEKIIKVDTLSTYTAVYNGVAKVMNKENPKDVDYYVSYEAKVNAGLNFEKIEIDIDEIKKEILISVPEIHVTEIVVDIGSLDFMFYNKKANSSSVTGQAFKACEKDVEEEAKTQEAIFDLAEKML